MELAKRVGESLGARRIIICLRKEIVFSVVCNM